MDVICPTFLCRPRKNRDKKVAEDKDDDSPRDFKEIKNEYSLTTRVNYQLIIEYVI